MATVTNVTINGLATLASGFAQRQVFKGYVDAYKDDMNYFDWLNQLPNGSEVTGDWQFDVLTEDTVQAIAGAVGASTAGTGGANKTIVFNGTLAVPRVQEIILFKSGVTGLVWSVTANSSNWDVVVKPIGSGVNIPAVADGESLSIMSNAGSEGGANTYDVRKPALTKRQNNIQIFETGDSITEIAGATMVEVPYQGNYYMVNKYKAQQLLIHKMQVANQSLFGVKDTFTGPDGKKLYFTDGIWTQTVAGGFSATSASAGVFDIVADGKTLAIAMDAARCGNEYMALAGSTAHYAIDVNSTSNSAFTGGGIAYAAYNGDEKVALAYGVKSLRFGGYTFNIQRFKTLEHKGLTGATGYEAFRKTILLLPTDNAMIKGGQSVPRVRMRYMAFNGNKSLRYMDVETGALAPNKTNNTRQYRYDIYSQQAPEVIDVQRLGRFILQ